MQEAATDIWSFLGQAVIAITTNGSLTPNGQAILGRGVARQASARFPGLRVRLGELLQTGGNHVHEIAFGLVSFPVEETPWSLPDLRLIARSAAELRTLADQRQWSRIVLPRPGCGGGGLHWDDVRPILERHLDQRFIVVTAADLQI